MFFLIINYIHNQIRYHDDNSKMTWWMQIALTIVALIDLTIAMSTNSYPWVAAFIRPFMIVLLYRVLRLAMRRYMYTVVSSMPMFCVVLVYVLYFSWML